MSFPLPSPSSSYLTHHKNPSLIPSFSPCNFNAITLPHPRYRYRQRKPTSTVSCSLEKHENSNNNNNNNIPPQNDVVELPLFPLPLVLFPGAILPLQIFEYRYRIMMHTLLQTDLRFGVIYTDPTTGTAEVGCVGEVVKHERLVDDRFFIICKGQERFRVTRVVRTKPYLVAEVAWLEDRPSGNGDEDLEGLASEVESHMKDVIRLSNRLNGKPEKEAGDLRRNLFPTPFSFFVGSTFEGAPREQHQDAVTLDSVMSQCLLLDIRDLAILWPDIIAKVTLHVDETRVTTLRNSIYGLEILVAQINALEIALDSGRRRALRQNNISSANAPGDQNLSKGIATLLRNLVQGLVCVDLLARRWNLVLRAKRRVGLRQNVVLEAKFDQFLVWKERMNLDLVYCGLDLCPAEHVLEARDCPVRDTDSSRFAGFIDLLHRPPRRSWVVCQLFFDHILSLLVQLGHIVLILLRCNRPVDEEKVQIIDFQLLQRALQAPFYFFRLVEVVPDFCADEDIAAVDGRVGFEEIGYGVTDLVFILVKPRAVKVTVTDIESVCDSFVGLAFGAFVGESAKTHCRDGNAVVERESLAVRHLE